MDDWKLYEVKLMNKINDWDATLRYRAPTRYMARKWSTAKMRVPAEWLIVSCCIVKEA